MKIKFRRESRTYNCSVFYFDNDGKTILVLYKGDDEIEVINKEYDVYAFIKGYDEVSIVDLLFDNEVNTKLLNLSKCGKLPMKLEEELKETIKGYGGDL